MSTKTETLERILASARRIFADTGFKKATMTKIASGAGVTKQLLYHYYNSKDDLFASVLNRQAETILATLDEQEFLNGDPETALRTFLVRSFDQYRKDPSLSALAQEAVAFHNESGRGDGRYAVLAPGLNEKIAALVRRGIKTGAFRPDVKADLFPAMAILATVGGVYNSHMMSGLLSYDTRSDEAMDRWRNYSVEFLISAIKTSDA